MSITRALIWKEWHEVRWFLYLGLFIFLGLPTIGALQAMATYNSGFEPLIAPWILALGGILGVFIAVGSTCHDLSGKLRDFWQSRPIGISRWLIIKYLIGLAVLVGVCVVPLVAQYVLELWIRRDSSTQIMESTELAPVLAVNLLLWIALYSIAFLFGCMVRRVAHATMLALTAMLVLYCLPLILPPLNWLSMTQLVEFKPGVGEVLRVDRAVGYALTMVALSVVALVLSLRLVRRDRHFEAGSQLMYWSVGLTVLLLFASAAFQVGSNLTILHEAKLSDSPQVSFYDGMAIYSDGRRGVLVERNLVCGFQLTSTDIHLGSVLYGEYPYPLASAWRPEHPDLLYVLAQPTTPRPDDSGLMSEPYAMRLLTIRLDNPQDPVVHQVNLTLVDMDLIRRHPGFTWPPSASMLIWQDRMYLLGRGKWAEFDLSNPKAPELVTINDLGLAGPYEQAGSLNVALPDIPGLPPEERLRAIIGSQGTGNRWRYFDDKTLVRTHSRYSDAGTGKDLVVYRLVELTDRMARFAESGRHQPTLLESMVGTSAEFGSLRDGLFCVSGYSAPSQRLTVFDVSDPRRPRPVGYFAVAGYGMFMAQALPDGRILAADHRSLYLLAAPRAIRR